MSRLRFAGLWLGAVVAIGCAVHGGAPESPAVAYQADPEALRRGRLLFRGTCGGYCHPVKPARRDAPYLFDCVWKHGGSDAEIFVSISSGYIDTRMPAWGGKLPDGDKDIWKLIAYLRSQRTCDDQS